MESICQYPPNDKRGIGGAENRLKAEQSTTTNGARVVNMPAPSVDDCFTEAKDRIEPPRPAAARNENTFSQNGDDPWRDQLMRGRPRRDGEKGPVLAILANAIIAMRMAAGWGLRFNEFAVNAVTQGTPWNSGPRKWTDSDDIQAADWLQHQGVMVSRDVAGQAVEVVARDFSFHPVREYFDSLRWDGESRLSKWLVIHLGCKPSPYVSAVGARWFISGAARIYQPGCKADCCLILEHEQGKYKSQAIQIIGGEWCTDEIADLGSKDSALQTAGVLIIELAELDSLSRPEVAKVKAFLSRSTDRFRPPYGKRLVEQPRQCIFAGTVNHSNYLRDETGGRRFWPVTCGAIDLDALRRDRDQLWAEAVVRYQDGSPWWLDTPELIQEAAAEQGARYEGDAWDPLILDWADSRIASGCDSVSVAEILEHCLQKQRGQWTRADEMRVGRCLTAARGNVPTASRWDKYRDRKRGMEWRYRPVVPTS